MDITMPTGTSYVLVFDTDSYAGNFERELCGYATGIHDEERGHGDVEAADALKAGGDLVRAIAVKRLQVPHAEYGMVSNAIRPTPGRLNDGHGRHYDAAPGEKGWPAYESVAVFLDAPLTPEEMAFVRSRAAEFAARPGRFKTPFRILDVYLVEVDGVVPVETRIPT